jgi:hypothetical protein
MKRPWVSLVAQARRAPLSRRTVLRGALRGAAVFLALPTLEAMLDGNGTAYACGGVIPRRFGLFFWGNGNLPPYWTPEGEGADWQLSPQLQPLANVKDQVTVVTGFSVKLVNDVPHTSGAAGILSGASAVYVGNDPTFSQPSIDQVIAAQIGGDTLYRSLQTSAIPVTGLSFNGPSSINPPESDPWALYQRLFGDTFREPGEEGVVDPTLALRRSVLDGVLEDIGALQGRVGAADRARLDQHLTGIRELEERLAQLEEDPPNLAACTRPAEPLASYPDVDGRPQLAARSRVMCDMLAMALACDQTRVFAHFLTEPLTDILFPGAAAGHHQLTHDEPDPQPTVSDITTQCVTELAYLVEAFRNVPEADGTLLDNCVILGCSEVSEGRTHSLDEMPIVLAGSCCGTLRTGQHVRSYTQDNASKIILSVIRAMDIPAASFGEDEAYVTDGLSEIEA